MSQSLRALLGTNVTVSMVDGSTIAGKLASVDDRFNLALRGAQDSALAGTPLERSVSADSIRIVRGESVCGVFAK